MGGLPRRVSVRDGPWLFGEYSVADAMYAPVVLRFRTYGAQFAETDRNLRGNGARRCTHARLAAAAAAERWIIEQSESGVRD